jgi:osmoprotectant transport system ATP-binding protein
VPPGIRRPTINATTRASTPGSAISIRNLTKRYRGSSRPAVDAVNLDIEPGEFVVLLGPSGCGKTTLLKMINRIYEPTSGEIVIDGVDVTSLDAPTLRRQIGYVIQQTGLFPHMRVRANIEVVPRLLNWGADRTRERVRELLDLVGLPPEQYADRYPGQLSGGEQQRVGLARALAAQPATMLMDEPFGALDAITRTRLQDELKRIHARISQTVLFVTHDIEEAVRLADRIVIMREGRIVQVGTPLDIVSRPADGFVADLVGADDALRRLSLMPVRAAMQPLNGQSRDGVPRVEAGSFLREALSVLVESGAHDVLVIDEGAPVGTLSMDSIQRAAALPKPAG